MMRRLARTSGVWLVLIYALVGIPMAFGQADMIASNGVRVAWDYSSMQQLAEQGGYPRLLSLPSGTLLAVYEDYQGDIQLKTSDDSGRSWSDPQAVFQSFHAVDENGGKEDVRVRMSNPELIALQDGRLLLACNYRPVRDGVTPFSIAVKISDDSGESWSESNVLYRAGKVFKDGCWEPSFLQLPSGEVHLYFANESPYRMSDEQEISLLRSVDNGQRWQGPTTVSFREGRRDGMPVAVLGDDDLHLAIEDNKIGAFKPYIVRSSAQASWSKPVSGDDPNRWYALDSLQADSVYMGAPYLLRLPGGMHLLSYQTNKDRNGDWEQSTMEVRIGNRDAREFTRPTRPFPIPVSGEGKWSSLALLPTGKIAALSSVKFQQEHVAPWLIEGHLLSDEIDLSTPGDSARLFVGSLSENRLNASLTRESRSVRIAVQRISENAKTVDGKREYGVYLDGDRTFRLCVQANQEAQWEERHAAGWKASNGPIGAQVEYVGPGETAISIPVEHTKGYRIGLSLTYDTPAAAEQKEWLVHMDPSDPKTWILLKF